MPAPLVADRLELEAADAYCRALTSGHYENFTVAAAFVDRLKRVDLMRIYAFCRTTDDLGDEHRDSLPLERLARWRSDVESLFAGRQPVHPVLVALRETVERRALPPQPFLDLIAANVQDQTVTHYADWPELQAYCMLSAAPVGRMVLRVFGIDDPQAEALSDDVCIGLQLANHAQDVSRDAVIGRRYLLDRDVAALGISGAVRALVERARTLLDSGRRLEPMAPTPLRVQLALYRLGGLAICDAIQRIGYQTENERPNVSAARKVGLVLRAALPSMVPQR
ncbi:MAG: squalene/phytoene synthase family protein [Candidatus Eremiobacteraeota bacterium]|nr:squalene/phytoene synthase family protein [Candidatus Eremiobacteraeota bacterium]